MLISNRKVLAFWCRIAILFVLIFCVSNVFALLSEKTLSHGFLYAYEDKLNSLKAQEGTKTVFVGGSSVLFGVSAQHYEKLSGEPTINMGLNAGAYDLYLSSVAKHVSEGDTVVMGLEFEAYTGEWQKFDDIALDLASITKDYFATLPLSKKPAYLYRQTLRNCNRVFDIFYNFLATSLEGEGGQLYIRKNMDSYGDFDLSLTQGTKNISPHTIKMELDEESVRGILSHIEDMESKGAQVYIVYPPVYSFAAESELQEMDKNLKSVFGDRIVGNIEDWVCDSNEKFFDTPYHLNSDGTMEHTEYYYHILKEKIVE